MSSASTQSVVDVRGSREALRGWWRVALELVVAVLLQIAVMDFHAWRYDESRSLYEAVCVLHGEVPYRDFWTTYPPGEFWALAWMFRLFGVSVLCDRIVFVVANAISVVAMIYVIGRLTGRWWLSRVAAVVALLWMSVHAAYASPIYPSLAMMLVATACMVRRWESGRGRWAAWAGVALGICAVFRYDVAVYALIALSVASVIDELRRPVAERNAFVGVDALKMCGAAAIVVLPVALWLLVRVRAHDLYDDLFALPRANERAMGGVVYSIVWLPMLAVLVALPVIVSGWRRRGGDVWRWTGVLALTLLTAFGSLNEVDRLSPLNMVAGVVAAFALIACMVAWVPKAGVGFRIAVLLVVAWAGVCALASMHTDYVEFRHNASMVRGTERDGASFAAACHPAAGLERTRCMLLPEDAQRVILAIESESRPGERIFVGVPRYDLLHASDVQFYFYSGREAATRWYDFEEGVQRSAPIQNDMVCEIERNQTRLVVRDDATDSEQNESRVSSGANVLGEYIDHNYVVERRFGQIELLKRVAPFAAPGVYCNG